MINLLTVFLFSIPIIFASYLVDKKYYLRIQILATAAFLGYQSPTSLFIFTLLTVGNYLILHQSNLSGNLKLSIVILIVFLVLLGFKFFVSIDKNILLPIGISYYSFKLIHYALEYYKGKTAKTSFTEYLAYFFYLPVILIGPINRFNSFVNEIGKKRLNTDYLSAGFERILYGISKIQIVASYLITIKLAGLIEILPAQSIWLKTYLESLKFVFNAFFMFSGYSDVAIGLSLLVGIRLNENFNYPFLSTNMREFWSRYHMSLSEFCKDYIYTPITSYYRNPKAGIFLTMIIIALWHEITPRYVIWGLLQFIGIYFSTTIKIGNSVILRNFCRLIVINFFVFSCVIISRDSFAEAIDTYKILLFIP
ncbi:MAG: MBOAT family O-acyltransferase [Bacteroidota bacterium]